MKSPLTYTALAVAFLAMFSIFSPAWAEAGPDYLNKKPPTDTPVATFAGGCFWCTESEFRPLPGVLFIVVGYTDGHTQNPTYEDVGTGQTGHAEAMEIYFDPDKISYEDLVLHFLTRAHDPTELNQQWVDEGTQYRSGIYYHDEEQHRIAQGTIDKLTAEKYFKRAIVTEVKPATTFWPAEEYHQNYYERYRETYGQNHRRIDAKKALKKAREKERLAR